MPPTSDVLEDILTQSRGVDASIARWPIRGSRVHLPNDPITQEAHEIQMLLYFRKHDPVWFLAHCRLNDSVDTHDHINSLTEPPM